MSDTQDEYSDEQLLEDLASVPDADARAILRRLVRATASDYRMAIRTEHPRADHEVKDMLDNVLLWYADQNLGFELEDQVTEQAWLTNHVDYTAERVPDNLADALTERGLPDDRLFQLNAEWREATPQRRRTLALWSWLTARYVGIRRFLSQD